MTALTIIAFTFIKKANFRLDPDNVGLIAGLAIVAFVYHHFNTKITKHINKVDVNSVIQSAILSS
jgi:hypothetical protein